MAATVPAPVPAVIPAELTHTRHDDNPTRLERAVAGFLVRYGPTTRETYRIGIAQWIDWCRAVDLDPLAPDRAHRPHRLPDPRRLTPGSCPHPAPEQHQNMASPPAQNTARSTRCGATPPPPPSSRRSGRRGREFKSPPPDQQNRRSEAPFTPTWRGPLRVLPPTLPPCHTPQVPSHPMAGYLRWRAGAWRLRVDTDPDPTTGKRRQVHRTIHAPNNRTGRRTAETELAKLVTEVQARRVTAGSRLTVAELLERYITHRAGSWSPGSADATRARVAQHITPTLGDVPIDRLRPVDLDGLYGQLVETGQSPSSVARLHDIVRAALRQAVRWDLIATSPADRVTPPARARTEVIPPAPEDVARLLAAAGPTLRAYLRLAALTGGRRGQLCALRWSDVDLDAGEIRFTRSLARVTGGTVEKGTKTGARYPVAIDPTTVALLRDHRRRQAEASLAAGAPLAPDAHLFARDPAGTLPWHPDGASQRFARLRARVGLEGMRLHDLRHYMATQLLAEGFDITTLTGRGGWADATTPLTVYGHFQPARDRAAAERLGQVLDDSG